MDALTRRLADWIAARLMGAGVPPGPWLDTIYNPVVWHTGAAVAVAGMFAIGIFCIMVFVNNRRPAPVPRLPEWRGGTN